MVHVMSGLLGFLLRSRCFCCPEVEKLQMTYPSSRPSEGSTLKINRTGEDGWTLSFLGPKGGRSLNRWVVNFRRAVVQQYSSQLWTVSQNLGLSLYDQINCVLKKEKIRFSSWFFYTLTISCQKIKKKHLFISIFSQRNKEFIPRFCYQTFWWAKNQLWKHVRHRLPTVGTWNHPTKEIRRT